MDEVVYTRTVFSGKRIRVEAGEVTLPNGVTCYKEVVRHPGAVVILPFINEREIILVKQYRYPVNEWIYELPAGTIERNEKPEETAYRELEEETGFKAGVLKHLLTFYTTPGICDEKMHAYVAYNLVRAKQKLEKGELLKVEVVGFNEAIEMIERGLIRDAKSIVALLYYELFSAKHV